MRASTARRADRPEAYTRLGIDPSAIAAHEDGMRTDRGKGSYEWWYFDAHLDDGSILVVVFYTKPLMEAARTSLAPYVTVELDRPDGTHREWKTPAALDGFHASTGSCDVTIGGSTFRNTSWADPHTFHIHVVHDDLLLDVDLVGQVPPWRPATGFMYFGAADEHFFAWLPSVPQGGVTAALTIAGNTEEVAGVGYHDHNWGD